MPVLTVNPQRAIILALATLQTFAQPGTQREGPKPRHPTQIHDSMKSLIKTFAGSWVIHLTSGGSEHGVNGSAGDGEEMWRAGPGSNSLIEEYHSTGTEGEIAGLGVFWREKSENGFKVFWCDNTAPIACRTLHNKADWKEGRLVLSDERYEDGKKHLFLEIFAFDTPDSFTQTLAEGESGGSLRPFLTIRAIRKKP
jgi:hypothetical protein